MEKDRETIILITMKHWPHFGCVHSLLVITRRHQNLCYIAPGGKLKSKRAMPVTDRGGLYSCEMLKIPYYLDNRLTVNCEILATCSSTYSPVRTSQEAHSVSIK
jgi:hypothetical protein